MSLAAIGIFPSHEGNGAPRGLSARDIHLVNVRIEIVVGHRNRRGIESIGFDDISAGLQILHVNLSDQIRPGETQDIVAASQIARVSRKTHAPKGPFIEPVLLNHRAHGAVEEHHPLLQ